MNQLYAGMMENAFNKKALKSKVISYIDYAPVVKRVIDKIQAILFLQEENKSLSYNQIASIAALISRSDQKVSSLLKNNNLQQRKDIQNKVICLIKKEILNIGISLADINRIDAIFFHKEHTQIISDAINKIDAILPKYENKANPSKQEISKIKDVLYEAYQKLYNHKWPAYKKEIKRGNIEDVLQLIYKEMAEFQIANIEEIKNQLKNYIKRKNNNTKLEIQKNPRNSRQKNLIQTKNTI